MESFSTTTVVVVTGMSGAGRSTALCALEDAGYFCIDNLPTPLIQSAIDSCERGGMRLLALGVDVRVRSFLVGAQQAVESLVAPGRTVRVVFLDASNEVLQRRFNSTRRPHPLSSRAVSSTEAGVASASQEAGVVLEGVQLERERLSPLRALADTVLDTTRLSVHQLRRQILDRFGPGEGRAQRLRVRLLSFGFKYGVPTDADLMFDVRFIENPYFVEELRPLSGLDAPVAQFVFSRDGAQGFFDRTVDLIKFALPRYEAEGKSYLTIGVGCTGGRHRSVAMSTALGKVLSEGLDFSIDVAHRDIREVEREAAAAAAAPDSALSPKITRQ